MFALPLPAWDEQVEQNRTPAILVISLTWKGQPLVNYETVVNLIGATKTSGGLRVKALLDTNEYETGVKITKSQMESLRIRPHKVHSDWNYTLEPSI